MHDLIGMIDYGKNYSTSINNSFTNAIWKRIETKRQVVSGEGMRVLCLSRTEEDQDYIQDNGFSLFLVGEIYFRSDVAEDLKRRLSATQVLNLYIEKGDCWVESVKGNFVVVIISNDLKTCRIINNRNGISPFYYYWDDKFLFFSSQLAEIVRLLPQFPKLDATAVLEQALFYYPLGSRTFFRNISNLMPAEIVTIKKGNGIKRNTYWHAESLYNSAKIPYKDALEMGAILFHKTANALANEQKLCVSFTSGFDSRAIQAVLEKNPADCLFYSFGIPGSLNVEIPRRAAARLGIVYQPFYLDATYEAVFNDYALAAVTLSDALSTVERANYPFVFSQLPKYSQYAITGLFGSELLRTFQNAAGVATPIAIQLSMSDDPARDFQIMAAAQEIYYAFENENQAKEEVYEDWCTIMGRYQDLPDDYRFFMFLLKEGLRKYFGAEIQMERAWMTNRFPFLDDEFVEFLFRAPFAGVYTHTNRPTIGNRFNSQFFYAYIIRKYKPELLKAPTDHGFAPRDLLRPFPLLTIGPKVLYSRWKRNYYNYREYKTEEWTAALYQEKLFERPINQDLFSQNFLGDYKNGSWKANRLQYAKAASLKLWLEAIGY